MWDLNDFPNARYRPGKGTLLGDRQMALVQTRIASASGRHDGRTWHSLAHTTILRWVQHYTPEFEKHGSDTPGLSGGSWRCDETYIKVRGEWIYLYRAVDKAGKTVDFYLSRKRNVNLAKAFLRKAMKGQGIPAKITLDAYAASHRAVAY